MRLWYHWRASNKSYQNYSPPSSSLKLDRNVLKLHLMAHSISCVLAHFLQVNKHVYMLICRFLSHYITANILQHTTWCTISKQVFIRVLGHDPDTCCIAPLTLLLNSPYCPILHFTQGKHCITTTGILQPHFMNNRSSHSLEVWVFPS